MKAEERHKLQTNALADRLGRMIRGAKQGPSRGTVLNIFLVLILVGLVVFFFWTRSQRRDADAVYWLHLYGGLQSDFKVLLAPDTPTQPNRAAKFQDAYLDLWEFGIKRCMADPFRSIQTIKTAQSTYSRLAEEVGDDPVYGPEALYGIAVAEEALAFEKEDGVEARLNSALKHYEAVSAKFRDSALAKDAAKRVADLKGPDNPRREQIVAFYKWMEQDTRLRRQIGEQKRFEEEFLQKMGMKKN
jgi:hypothetical protein